MNAADVLQDCRWSTPPSYGGHSPVNDYLIYTQCRDSGLLETTNYAGILAALQEAAKAAGAPESVYDFRARCWAFGWHEYIIVKASAPESVLDTAASILCALADYPVLDDMAFSDATHQAACDAWRDMPVHWRMEECAKAGVTYFAARHDGIPESMYDHMHEYVL